MGSTNNYKSGHLKGLNGIRAICALILLWGHIPQPDFCNWGQILSLPLPDCCAYIFFVLSGFLAGYTSYSDFSTSLYYQKRARKILPLYYGYVLLSVTTFIVLGKEDDVITPNLL